jgi:hypothetical protein
MFSSLLISFFGFQNSIADVAPIEVVFMCTTEKANKTLSLFKQGSYFIYQYGPSTGKPEISVAAKESEVVKEPWNGMGSTIWSNITIKNGEYSYTVHSAYTRNTGNEESEDSFGVNISKGDAYISSVKCKNEPHIDQLSSFVE